MGVCGSHNRTINVKAKWNKIYRKHSNRNMVLVITIPYNSIYGVASRDIGKGSSKILLNHQSDVAFLFRRLRADTERGWAVTFHSADAIEDTRAHRLCCICAHRISTEPKSPKTKFMRNTDSSGVRIYAVERIDKWFAPQTHHFNGGLGE